MRRRLVNQQLEPRRLNALAKILLALFALLLTPNLAWAEDYQLWIGGTQVTDANKGNIQSDSITAGYVSYDSSTQTLTLQNATIIVGVYSNLSKLTIYFKGEENHINNTDNVTGNHAIWSYNPNAELVFQCDNANASVATLYLDSKQYNKSVICNFDKVTYATGAYLYSPSNPVEYTIFHDTDTDNDIKMMRQITLNNPCFGMAVTSTVTYPLWIEMVQMVAGNVGNSNFDPNTNTLTMNTVYYNHPIVSGLDELTIEFSGENNGEYIKSVNEEATLTLKGVTNGTNPSTLSLTNTVGKPAVEGFASLTLDGVYLKTDFASQYVPGNSPAIRNVKGGTVASATFTTTLYYPLWVSDQQVNGTNYTDVLDNGTVSYVHNDANNTGILTLNGAIIDSSDAIEGFLNGLTIYLKGDNSLSTYTYEYSPISSGIGTAELTITKHPDATGNVSLSLAYSGTAAPVISGFSSVSYTGLNFVSKTGATLDGATTYDAVLSSGTIYPLWIDGTMVTEANKNAILGADNTKVTYDGDTNNGGTNTLTLNNYSYTGSAADGHAIETKITGLKVKLVGENTIDCENNSRYNSNYAFYTSQSTASIQFVKDDETSVLIMLTEPENPFGGFADGKITYDGLVYYSEEKYIAVPTAPKMAEVDNKVKLTRDPYEGGTIVIKYSIDYADGKTAGVTEATYSEPFAMEAPGTVTAWVEANNGRSSEKKGKYFGYKDAPFTLKVDDTLTPELIPAIETGDNIGYPKTAASPFSSSATDVATFTDGTIAGTGVGTATLTANIDYTSDIQPVVILNPEKKFTADVNVGTIPEITFADGMEYATYCNTTGYDLTIPAGLKAYAVTGTNGDVVTLAEVDFLPKVDGTDYVALLLKREDTSAAVGLALVSAGGTRPTTNCLMYNYTAADITTTGYEYVLYKEEFLKATGTIPNGKCYLKLSGGAAPARASYGISHGEGNDTGSDNLVFDEDGTEKWYDLRGRRIEKPTKAGLYIRNGEKIVVNDNNK